LLASPPIGENTQCAPGLYARVSTHDQQTLSLQRCAMRDFARRHGWTIAHGSERRRLWCSVREFRQKLLHAARRGDIEVVVAWRLDRWGCFHGRLGHDTSGTPQSGCAHGLLAVFVEFEREILQEGVRAGLAPPAHGKRLGRLPSAALSAK